tara:strand:+ start:246 stop:362 length:117 start_codon:yes stop_codon:yes gene_type:complete
MAYGLWLMAYGLWLQLHKKTVTIGIATVLYFLAACRFT